MVLAICIPIVIQNVLQILQVLLDNIMIGQLGTLSMSGVFYYQSIITSI